MAGLTDWSRQASDPMQLGASHLRGFALTICDGRDARLWPGAESGVAVGDLADDYESISLDNEAPVGQCQLKILNIMRDVEDVNFSRLGLKLSYHQFDIDLLDEEAAASSGLPGRSYSAPGAGAGRFPAILRDRVISVFGSIRGDRRQVLQLGLPGPMIERIRSLRNDVKPKGRRAAHVVGVVDCPGGTVRDAGLVSGGDLMSPADTSALD